MSIGAFHMTLLLTTLLCSLVVGLLFGFAVVVMPGISNAWSLTITTIFSRRSTSWTVGHPGQPTALHGGVGWFHILGSGHTGSRHAAINRPSTQPFVGGGGVVSAWSVQAPTIRFNIPLNNALQGWDLRSMDEAALTEARTAFEAPWNRWNRIRTFNGIVSVSVLLFVLLKL